jgi:hypothetical protein
MITEGEWLAKSGQIYIQETGKSIAIIPYFDKENEEHASNEKLMAAAPELLAACVEFVRKVDCGKARSTKSYKQMSEAIAKAEQ